MFKIGDNVSVKKITDQSLFQPSGKTIDSEKLEDGRVKIWHLKMNIGLTGIVVEEELNGKVLIRFLL